MFQPLSSGGRQPEKTPDTTVLSAFGEPLPRLSLPAPLRYVILGVLLFLLIGAQGGGMERQSAILAVVLLVVGLIGPMPHWAARHRLSLPALAVFLYFILNCAAGLYSRFGNFAAPEFGKILAAFCVFALVLFRARRGEAPCLAAMAATVSAAYGLLSIDAASARVLSTPFTSLTARLFGFNYYSLYTGYEQGVRITGIFGNPNFLAGFLALGVLLSLYVVRVTGRRGARLPACLVLMVNTLSFLLTFSMGAIAAFVAAVLLYLLAERRERQISLLVLLVETAVLTLAASAVAVPGLGGGSLALLPDLAGLIGGLLLWALHEFGGLPLAGYLAGKGRTAAIAAAGLAVVLVLYVILAFQITGSYSLTPGETLRRAVYPQPGTYTLEGNWTGEVTVTVEAQSTVDAMMHTSTVLYSGALEEASFTVPEDTRVVYLSFRAGEGAVLDKVSLSDGPTVKLRYLLLPGFAANRIQGLWANQNAIQRLVFFQDGLRIYQQSPIIGNGLGSVEGLIFSVQDFHYETKYVHNHYIQVLAEMGIPGLLSFLFLVLSAAVTLVRRRLEGEEDPLLPALVGCLSISILHSLTEVDWSIGVYQIMALLTIGMMAAFFARPLPAVDKKAAGVAAALAPGALCAVFALLLGGNVYAEKAYDEVLAGMREQTPYTMTELARIDRYNWSQYELDMAVNAAESPVEEYAATAAKYAQHCRALKIYTVNRSLEQYVYLPMGRYEELFQASREGLPQAASQADAWQQEFDLYETALLTLSPDNQLQVNWMAKQIQRTYEMLTEYNQGRLEYITLSDQNLRFLNRVLTLAATDFNGQEGLDFLNRLLFDSDYAADTDSDGVPDSMLPTAGTLTPASSGWDLSSGGSFTLSLVNPGGGQPTLTLRCSDPSAFTLQLNGAPVETTADGDTLTAVLPAAVDGGIYELSLSSGVDCRISYLNLTCQ